ncbi:MAG: hypothetical protein NT004_01340 [Bacteroidetes bacterium]|nr:hypothetical protein [Bacteroidota bacterium]
MPENSDLQQKKLEAEIKLLEAQLKDKPKESKIESLIKNWIGIVLTIISVCSAIGGLIVPSCNYIAEKKNELTYNLNTEMIGLVDKLSDTNSIKCENAAILLGYYERNATPVLLAHLESPKDEMLYKRITSVLCAIYEKDPKETINLIDMEFERNMSIMTQNPDYSKQEQDAILNLLKLVKALRSSPSNASRIINYIKNFKYFTPNIIKTYPTIYEEFLTLEK